ncbi:MAG: polysaccharide biosynthesis/export family protein, partial [Chloroflexi bacterium]|nr:polysaccharide biosynthesis/export family protein [Chloroflexota bacterium]
VPAAPQPPASPSATATPAVEEYYLGAGDKLRIEVYKDAQLSQSAQIRPDGKITMPLIGDLVASGKTPEDLRDVIATALREYMTDPVVTVIVVETTVATAYVVGEVRQPGAVPLQQRVTVLQALALAGGLTEFAKNNDIRVLRTTDAGVEAIGFNYRDAVRGSASAQMYLQSGDTVVVPD